MTHHLHQSREEHAEDVLRALTDYVGQGAEFTFAADRSHEGLTITFKLGDDRFYDELLEGRMAQHPDGGETEQT